MKNIHEIKEAIKEPASKEWFKKHGLPKGLGPKKKEVAKKMSHKDDGVYNQTTHSWKKQPKWMIESGKKTRKAFTALAKKNDNWEEKDTL